jgi:hypothetical protein
VPVEYGMARLVFEGRHFEPLSREEFETTRQIRRRLAGALGIEERLDLLLENFAEFERELLGLGVRAATFEEKQSTVMIGRLQTVQRRLVNLLSTGYLYSEQVPGTLRRLFGRRTEHASAFEQELETTRQADTGLGLRAMEELRNHIQHHDLPLQSLTFTGSWFTAPTGDWHLQTVEPTISLNRLAEDRGFDSGVLAELRSLGDGLNIKLLVREYVTALGSAHATLRASLAPELSQWDAHLNGLIDRYRQAAGEESVVGLAAVIRDEQGAVTESLALFVDPVERRKHLEGKNRWPRRLDRAIVTSQ